MSSDPPSSVTSGTAASTINDLYSGAVSDLNDTGFALMNKANVKYVYDRK